MALTFLTLTNDVLLRLNEVQLGTTDFASASGIYQDAKNAVNAALNRVNRDAFEWPFNHEKQTLTLTPGQNTYPYPAEAKTIAFDTFRIKRSTAFNTTGNKLRILDFEEFLEKFPEYEDEVEVNSWGVPLYIIRNRDLSFTVYPTPREPYEIVFEFYTIPPVLSGWDDEPTVPDFFRWTIVDGAMYHAHVFRGALEEAAAANSLFEEGLKDMRSLFINRYEYTRSTMIRR